MLVFILILALIFGSVPEQTISDIGSSAAESSSYQVSYEENEDTETDSSSQEATEDFEQEFYGKSKSKLLAEIEEYENTEDDELYEFEVEEEEPEESAEYVFSEPTGYDFGCNIEDGRYVFNTHVFSDRTAEILGEDKREAFFNLCDALESGNDTFLCPNKNAFNWVTNFLFLNNYFPPAAACIEPVDYSDGVGTIEYLIPVDEFLERVNEFEYEIEDILNSTVSPDYSDFEKTLSLYVYMTQNYTYDHDATELDIEDRAGYIMAYRALQNKCGICTELCSLYSYLLMQCGVHADIIRCGEGHEIEPDRTGHRWSLVRIDGVDYHVDPTYGLSRPNKYDGATRLNFFLMSDSARQNLGNYNPDYYVLNAFKPKFLENCYYKATDDRYFELAHGYFVDMDTDNNIVYYFSYKTKEVTEFYYD
ncbi:hypothetical protein D6853_03660 [Butyrivibrio sp. X503]|uniref:transglutaminase domain-containing protein n=1 Tax=Butyrivibrio sp. X503 TaxID=2364878 RepID=UPI000EAAB35F|nr:hypothetical protein [Butyrivibrio sp. X503]RKM57125.1 hypothetical protein D6853_03660 [Butyrivibrio sp. X503]